MLEISKAIITNLNESEKSPKDNLVSKRVKKLKESNEYEYMLLDRLKQDCEYFLGNGNRSEKHLWAGSIDAQIAKMKEIWNKLKEKPEWLSMEDIEKYEKEMKNDIDSSMSFEENKDLNESKLPNISKFIHDLDKDTGNAWSAEGYTKDSIGNKIIMVSKNGESDKTAKDITKAVEAKYKNLKGEISVNKNHIWFYLKEAECLKETGEWDDSDEEMKNWKEDMRNQANYLANKIDGDLKSVKGFDKYTGPIAIITTPKHGDVIMMFDPEDDTGFSFIVKIAHVGNIIGGINQLAELLNKDEIEDDYILENTILEELNINIHDYPKERDYIISDVTVLEPVSDGDIQSPNIQALLLDLEEALSESYGVDWGTINIQTTKKNSESSFALIETELAKDTFLMNFIINGKGALKEFVVTNTNGTTIYKKKTLKPVQAMYEWLDSELLVGENAPKAKLKEAEDTLVSDENGFTTENIEKFINSSMNPELIETKAEIDCLIAGLKEIPKDKQEFIKVFIKNKIYSFITELPYQIRKKKDEDTQKDLFTSYNDYITKLFGKDWTMENLKEGEALKEGSEYIREYKPGSKEYQALQDVCDKLNAMNLDGKFEVINTYFDFGQRWKWTTIGCTYKDGSYQALSPRQHEAIIINNNVDAIIDEIAEALNNLNSWKSSKNINESYDNITIGNISLVYNPQTHEALYSIDSADVHDKRLNLAKVPSVDTPYDTETIIKDYIEKNYGPIPQEEKEVDVETKVEEPSKEVPVDTETIDVQMQDEPEINEADEELEGNDTNALANIDIDANDEEVIDEPETEETPKETQETGSEYFFRMPKSVADMRVALQDGVSQGKSTYLVVGTQELSQEEFNKFSDNLKAPQQWLEGVRPVDLKNYAFNVVKVTCPGENYSILVDPSATNFAKFAAIKDNA